MNCVYMAFSRALCNFSFPPTIKRYFSSSLYKLREEIDTAEDFDISENDANKKEIEEKTEKVTKKEAWRVTRA